MRMAGLHLDPVRSCWLSWEEILGKFKGGFGGPNNTSLVGEKGFSLLSTLVRAFHALPKTNDGEIFPGLVSLAKAEKCL